MQRAFRNGCMRVKFDLRQEFCSWTFHFWLALTVYFKLEIHHLFFFLSYSLCQVTYYVDKFKLWARRLRIYRKANNLGHNKRVVSPETQVLNKGWDPTLAIPNPGPRRCVAVNTSSHHPIGSPRLSKSHSPTKQAYERKYP